MRKWPFWLLHSSIHCVFFPGWWENIISKKLHRGYWKKDYIQHHAIFSFHIFITQHLPKMSYMSNLLRANTPSNASLGTWNVVESQKLMGWIFYSHPELLIPLKLLYQDIRRWTGCWKLTFFTFNFGCVTTDAQNDRPGEGDSFQNYGHFWYPT